MLFIGAFVAAPIGGLLWAAGAFALRITFQWIQAKRKGVRFDGLDRPPPPSPALYTGRVGISEDEPEEHSPIFSVSPQKGKLF